jgi:hypothetical protein
MDPPTLHKFENLRYVTVTIVLLHHKFYLKHRVFAGKNYLQFIDICLSQPADI